jgi:hypothetical protein
VEKGGRADGDVLPEVFSCDAYRSPNDKAAGKRKVILMSAKPFHENLFHRVHVMVAAAVIVTPLVVTGCGERLPGGMVKVQGKILLDDQPLTHNGDGVFILNLASKTNTNTSTARFNKSDGAFEIVIQPGEYIATVTATDGFDQDNPKNGTVTPAKSLVPEKYRVFGTSDAKVVVPPNGGEITVQLITK